MREPLRMRARNETVADRTEDASIYTHVKRTAKKQKKNKKERPQQRSPVLRKASLLQIVALQILFQRINMNSSEI